ncbi:hypothetical protein LEMLEM_LOCUS13054 [Lemmus lemmus]
MLLSSETPVECLRAISLKPPALQSTSASSPRITLYMWPAEDCSFLPRIPAELINRDHQFKAERTLPDAST